MSHDFYTTRTVRSKRDRRCRASGATILKGENYVRVSGKWEGDFFSEAYHTVVSPIFEKWNTKTFRDDGEGLDPREFLSDLSEWAEGAPSDAMSDAQEIAKLPGVSEWFVKKYS